MNREKPSIRENLELDLPARGIFSNIFTLERSELKTWGVNVVGQVYNKRSRKQLALHTFPRSHLSRSPLLEQLEQLDNLNSPSLAGFEINLSIYAGARS